MRIAASDLRRAARFYGELFGWVIVAEEAGTLRFRTPGGLGGAFWSAGVPSTAGFEVYVRVTSLEDTIRRAIELGGARLARPHDDPSGRVAQILDSEGNRVCLWEPGGPADRG
jgi:predicted enzyme related to lactoylglutathione lyase